MFGNNQQVTHSIIKALSENIDDCEPIARDNGNYKELHIDNESHVLIIKFDYCSMHFHVRKKGKFNTLTIGSLNIKYFNVGQIIDFVKYYSCLVYDSRHEFGKVRLQRANKDA